MRDEQRNQDGRQASGGGKAEAPTQAGPDGGKGSRRRRPEAEAETEFLRYPTGKTEAADRRGREEEKATRRNRRRRRRRRERSQ